MKQRYPAFILSLAVSFMLVSCSQQDTSSVLSGPYFGLKSPGKEPKLFLPGLVSTHFFERCTGFLDRGRVCVFQRVVDEKVLTFYMYEKDGSWTEPVRAPFENERGGTDFTIAPDHKTLVFQSGRPAFSGDDKRDSNAWVVEWTGAGWTKPRLLPHPANTNEFGEGYPSLAEDGSFYFFTWSKKECLLGDVFRSKYVDGSYLNHERFGYPVNSAYHENDPCIAPDESYIIVKSGRPGGYTYFDTYISFQREDGSWTSLHNLGEAVNAVCPGLTCVTPDGKYFFFTGLGQPDISKGSEVSSEIVSRWGDYDTYWVETTLFDDLKAEFFHKQSAAEVVVREYEDKGLDGAVDSLKQLYLEEQGTHFFELSEFMMLCGRMIAAENSEDAAGFYKILLETLPDKFRTRLGYAQASLLNGQTAAGLNLLSELKSGIRPLLLKSALSHYVWELKRRLNPEGAVAVLHFFIQEFPDASYAYVDLAEILVELGDTVKAAEKCRQALKIKQDFQEAAELLKKLEKKGEYLGQKPPGKIPEIFAPGFISTGKAELNSVFTPDGREFYFAVYTPGKGCKMYFTKDNGSGWTQPEPVPFSSQNSDVDMCITSDGTRMYFGSTRPINGIEQKDYKIWYVEREGGGWSKAKYLDAPINNGRRALYPSISSSGTMFFQAVRDDSFGSRDIYYSRLDTGGFTEPIHLGREINSEYSEGDVLIAPDESYMIVSSSGRPDDLGNSDLYISFKKEGGSWTRLQNMGNEINSPETDYCPMLSPDGKYFFFTSKRSGNGDIYWVDAKIINDFK